MHGASHIGNQIMHSINHANILLSFLGLDTFVFPTEDDRYNIILFQLYANCRLAELVYAMKVKAYQDFINDTMHTDEDGQQYKAVDIGCDRQH